MPIPRYRHHKIESRRRVIDSNSAESIIVPMERQFSSNALSEGVAMTAFLFFGCATTQSGVSNNPQLYPRLSATAQALVNQGQIRRGMTVDAVWLAWGIPEQKIPGDMHGGAGETWVYLRCATP